MVDIAAAVDEKQLWEPSEPIIMWTLDDIETDDGYSNKNLQIMYTNICKNLCIVPATEDAQSTYTKTDEYAKGMLEW